ncbi:hypothetical protein E2320_020084, partial [Naja naja]
TIIWQKNRVLDHKMAFMEVVGPAVMKNMVPFQQHREDLDGFVPMPDSDRSLTGHSNSERSYIFINSRPVYQKEILKLVQQYYSTLHKDFNRLFPIFFLNITVPPSAVDVNLIPDKSQVLVHNKESICLAIEESLISLYGPLNSSVSYEMNASNKTSKDINEGEQEVLSKSCTRINPLACTSQYSLSNDIQNANVQKNRLVGNETIYNYSHDTSTEIEIPDNEIVGYDQFQDEQPNNVLCQDQQNKETFNLDNNTAMDIQYENSMESDSRNYSFQKERGVKTSADSSEITADKWSLGNAFKNSRAENLEPVQILIPNMDEVRTPKKKSSLAKLQEESNSQIVKKPNVIKDKMGQITAYDLISNKVIRKSMSAFELFVQDYSPDSLNEITKLNSEKLLLKMEAMWNSLNEEEKKKYEEKAGKDLERYNRQGRKAMCQNRQTSVKEREKRHKIKLKDCLNNQQKLDTLFNSQIRRKHDDYEAIKTIQLPFSMDTFKQNLQRLEHKKADQEESCLIRLPNFPDAWILASEEKIEMLNPYRIEEALLFKKLIENHKLPIEKLDTPIILTESLFSDAHYMEVLCSMSRESTRLDGSSYLLDPRLVANGFKIRIMPGTSAVESQLEIEGMTSCLPYYGISDLKEILSAVINNNAQEVYECRPLKVVNYLEGEAVRLSRKLPLYLSEEDVQNTINRMGKQLGTQHNSCVHGRPFTHFLTKIPPNN